MIMDFLDRLSELTEHIFSGYSFAMFYSHPPYADLIFQDATTQLMVIPPAQRWYSDYLGKDFMRAKRIVDCYAGASHMTVSLSLLVAAVTFIMLN